MSNTIFNERTNFELYLEGIKVPFNAVTVREIEGGYPTADISFPATSGILQTLPGTIVQFFGPDPRTEEQILLYEGEITGYSYNKTQTGRYISFSTRSFLEKWKSITARPADAMATQKYKEAAGENKYAWFHLSKEDKDAAGQESNSRYSQIVENLAELVKADTPPKLNDALSEIRLTEFASFRDEINALLSEDSPFVAGDVDQFLQFFLRKFEIYDPYYGIQANSFGIADSVTAFPNVGNIEIHKTVSILESFFAISQEMQETDFSSNALTLIAGIQQLLQFLSYTFIAPSTFTGSHRFWAKDEDSTKSKKPVRGYMLPNLEHSPPAKFNTFFSHQVENFSFSRGFYSEPTRTIGTLNTPYFSGLQNGVNGLEAFVVEPNLDLTEDGAKKNSIGFTPEETYQGIRPMVRNFNTLMARSIEKLDTEEKKALNEENLDAFNSKIKMPLQQLTEGEHYRAKYTNRGCNLRTVWSPHRMVGVPGTYIESGDGPSFVGMVSAITNTYDGRGNVSSTIRMRAVRVIDDMRELIKENPNGLEDLINEFTRDPFPDINSNLYDPEVYKFDRIGKTVYPFLKWGELGEFEVLKNYAENGDAFSDHTDNINDLYGSKKFERGREDCSILDQLVRNDDGEIITSQSEDILNNSDNLHRRSANYTKYVYLAVYSLKDKINSFGEDNAKGLDAFTQQYTYRNITTKEEYFSSVNTSQANGISDSINYKDGMALFIGTEQMSRIKDQLDSAKAPPLDVIVRGQQIEELKLKWRTLKMKLYDLAAQMSVGVLKNGEGESMPNLLQYGYNQNTGAFEIQSYTPVASPLAVNGLSKDESLAQRFSATKEDLATVEEELEKLGVNLKTLETNFSLLPTEFENEVFKPYNLTRKRHIEFGFTRFIRDNFKNLRVIE